MIANYITPGDQANIMLYDKAGTRRSPTSIAISKQDCQELFPEETPSEKQVRFNPRSRQTQQIAQHLMRNYPGRIVRTNNLHEPINDDPDDLVLLDRTALQVEALRYGLSIGSKANNKTIMTKVREARKEGVHRTTELELVILIGKAVQEEKKMAEEA